MVCIETDGLVHKACCLSTNKSFLQQYWRLNSSFDGFKSVIIHQLKVGCLVVLDKYVAVYLSCVELTHETAAVQIIIALTSKLW